MPDKSHHIDYSELCCISNFSFQRGASHPSELVERAASLGYQGIALTDECSLAGAVQALLAAEKHAVHLIVGSRFILADGSTLVVLVRNRAGYTQLCRLITRARRHAHKGHYHLDVDGLANSELSDCWLLVLPVYDTSPTPTMRQLFNWLATQHPRRARIALALHQRARDAAHIDRLQRLQ